MFAGKDKCRFKAGKWQLSSRPDTEVNVTLDGMHRPRGDFL